jgi:hypothetical protein
MGIVWIHDDGGSTYIRKGGFRTPTSDEDAKFWFAKFGTRNPSTFVTRADNSKGVESDSGPLVALASVVVAGPLGPLVMTKTVGQIGKAMLTDIGYQLGERHVENYPKGVVAARFPS